LAHRKVAPSGHKFVSLEIGSLQSGG